MVFVWPLGFGICCSFSLEGLSCPSVPGPPCLSRRAQTNCHFHLLARCPSLWPPQALASPLLVPVPRGPLGIYLLLHPVCLTQRLACGRPPVNVCGGNEINLQYCITEQEPGDVNDLGSRRIPLYRLSREKSGLRDQEPGSHLLQEVDLSLRLLTLAAQPSVWRPEMEPPRSHSSAGWP